MGEMNDSKSWLDGAIELFVYAPVGALMSAAEDLPGLVEKGRAKVTGEMSLARMVGNFAVNQGQSQAGKLAQEIFSRLVDLTQHPNGVSDSDPWPPPPSQPVPSPPPASAREPASAPSRVRADRSARSNPPVPASELAIPGYDSLSASQVVQRLAGLTTTELEAVRTYEIRTRDRKTIVGRATQLLASQDA